MSEGLAEQKIGFLGCGAMARALCGGLVAGGVPKAHLRGSDPNPSQRENFADSLGIETTGDNEVLVASSDIVVLCTKPGLVAEAIGALPETLRTEPRLWISIAAGIRLSALEQSLGTPSRIIRVMPNTPALVGQGASVFCPNASANESDRAAAESLLAWVGTTWEAPNEEMLDAVTGLSGSGPAYVFLFLEALAEAGQKQGLPREAADALAFQTVLGAARLAIESELSPAELRAQVSSPGGTTVAGLAELDRAGFRDAVDRAVTAATHRSRELGE
ncbi:MAG: pyrroline-5-carboxylate reductase [bacterium TMED88]|nr:pyrroline-5-carboxylate reductase [Deltaproteobacteria bacterium]OUV31591.1 MAG: pyrroline-5-carboxylate reductase [bacterium TMED88]